MNNDLHHPEWCNKTHQAGADPRRQHHLNTWRSTHGQTLAMKLEMYPFKGLPAHVNKKPGIFFTVTVDYGWKLVEAGTVLRLKDLRSLAAHITAPTDAAESMTIPLADTNGLEQWW